MKRLILTIALLILASSLSGCIVVAGHHHGYTCHEVFVAHPRPVFIRLAPAPHYHAHYHIARPGHPRFGHMRP